MARSLLAPICGFFKDLQNNRVEQRNSGWVFMAIPPQIIARLGFHPSSLSKSLDLVLRVIALHHSRAWDIPEDGGGDPSTGYDYLAV